MRFGEDWRDEIEAAALGISDALHDLRWKHNVPMPNASGEGWIGDVLPDEPAAAVAFLREVADRLERGVKKCKAVLADMERAARRRA